ncbi:Alpha-aspartyl dipeptidase [Liparis tanakae]|uniref:Alpha-aspartyl dipeptidase n=1 Tax=Liparis tanakae TaxID=230148 RepID=A0A4Z2HUR6_9TELE|nr:Alpha-aspartyl dipeptidase [Liparis tanakae]
MKRRLLLVSNSTLHGGGYLEHCEQHVGRFFGRWVHARARTDRHAHAQLSYELDSVHEAEDPVEAVRRAEAIFIGGGNTFRLLKSLYDNQLLTEIRRRVLEVFPLLCDRARDAQTGLSRRRRRRRLICCDYITEPNWHEKSHTERHTELAERAGPRAPAPITPPRTSHSGGLMRGGSRAPACTV